MPKSSTLPTTRRSSRARNEHQEKAVSEEFHVARRMYRKLAWRAKKAPLFLPRTLHRKGRRPATAPAPPAILYMSNKDSMEWAETVADMRCLWCKHSFFAFIDLNELLLHLRICHPRFHYSLSGGRVGRDRKPNGNSVTVSLSLASNRNGFSDNGDENFSSYDKEGIYINPRKLATTSDCAQVSLSELPASKDHETDSSQQRRKSSRASPDESAQELPEVRRHSRSASRTETARPTSPEKGTGSNQKKRSSSAAGQTSGKGGAKRIKVDRSKTAFPNVAAAVKEKRLYHSVLQHPLSLQEFEDGADSDADATAERQWRLDLSNFYVCDYVDSLPTEKLFMNLWNQFVTLDHPILADRKVAAACMLFVKKYRLILHRFTLEVTFMRHLTEMAKTGLLNSDSVFEILTVLRDRDEVPKNEEEASARFLYAEESIAKADENKRKAASATSVKSTIHGNVRQLNTYVEKESTRDADATVLGRDVVTYSRKGRKMARPRSPDGHCGVSADGGDVMDVDRNDTDSNRSDGDAQEQGNGEENSTAPPVQSRSGNHGDADSGENSAASTSTIEEENEAGIAQGNGDRADGTDLTGSATGNALNKDSIEDTSGTDSVGPEEHEELLRELRENQAVLPDDAIAEPAASMQQLEAASTEPEADTVIVVDRMEEVVGVEEKEGSAAEPGETDTGVTIDESRERRDETAARVAVETVKSTGIAEIEVAVEKTQAAAGAPAPVVNEGAVTVVDKADWKQSVDRTTTNKNKPACIGTSLVVRMATPDPAHPTMWKTLESTQDETLQVDSSPEKGSDIGEMQLTVPIIESVGAAPPSFSSAPFHPDDAPSQDFAEEGDGIGGDNGAPSAAAAAAAAVGRASVGGSAEGHYEEDTLESVVPRQVVKNGRVETVRGQEEGEPTQGSAVSQGQVIDVDEGMDMDIEFSAPVCLE